MAIANFIPEVWSARLKRILEPRLVLTQPRVMNRNWEGEVADKGDTVHIRTFTTGGAIRDYSRNTPMAAPDRAGDGELTLTVDQAKAFYIAVDDIDVVQADLTIMDKFLERTARNLAVVLDTFAASKFVAGAAGANTIGSDAAPVELVLSGANGTTKLTPYQFCVEARKRLQKQSTPGDDRWMVINADMEALFLQDSQFTQGGGGIGDSSVVRQGQIGRIAGFDILTTEAITASAGSGGTPVANHKVVFGDGNYSLTWADQIVKVEAERLQGEFGDALKGLNVYGAKIIEPESYGIAHVKD